MTTSSRGPELLDRMLVDIVDERDREAFQAEVEAIDEADSLVRELRLQMLLASYMARKQLFDFQRGERSAYPAPEEAQDRRFSRAMSLLRLYKDGVETIRRFKAAVPDGGTLNQTIIVQAEKKNGEVRSDTVDCEVITEEPAALVEGELQGRPVHG